MFIIDRHLYCHSSQRTRLFDRSGLNLQYRGLTKEIMGAFRAHLQPATKSAAENPMRTYLAFRVDYEACLK